MRQQQSESSLLDGVWDQLPPELLERVLPFLPVPVLCRFRTICKRWNTLISTPEFGTLCAHNASQGLVQSACFVVKHRIVSTRSGRSKDIPTWSIFDKNASRWYNFKNEWIVNGVTLEGYDSDVPSMDGGLVCTAVNAFTEEQLATSTIDNATHPQTLIVANLMGSGAAVQVLPNPPLARIDLCWLNLKLVVEEISHYKLFLICVGSFWNQLDPCMCVYDSATNQWRNPPNPPVQNVGARVRSVVFRGVWYVLFSGADGVIHQLCGYNFTEDTWDDTGVQFWQSSMLDWCDLVVSDNRLFLLTQRSVMRMGFRKKRRVFKPLDISEISLGEKSCRTVMRLRETELCQRLSNAKISAFGLEKSILLMCTETGRMMLHHLNSGLWEFLPTNPMECLHLDSVKTTGRLSRHGKQMSYLRLPNTPWDQRTSPITTEPSTQDIAQLEHSL